MLNPVRVCVFIVLCARVWRRPVLLGPQGQIIPLVENNMFVMQESESPQPPHPTSSKRSGNQRSGSRLTASASDGSPPNRKRNKDVHRGSSNGAVREAKRARATEAAAGDGTGGTGSTGSTPSSTGGKRLSSVRMKNEMKAPQKSVTNPEGTLEYERPVYSYAELAALAIRFQPSKNATVQWIYDWICENYPFYKFGGAPFWKNCIRHNLSMKKCFKRLPNADGTHLWCMADGYDSGFPGPIEKQRVIRLNGHSKVAAKPRKPAATKPGRKMENQLDAVETVSKDIGGANRDNNSSPKMQIRYVSQSQSQSQSSVVSPAYRGGTGEAAKAANVNLPTPPPSAPDSNPSSNTAPAKGRRSTVEVRPEINVSSPLFTPGPDGFYQCVRATGAPPPPPADNSGSGLQEDVDAATVRVEGKETEEFVVNIDNGGATLADDVTVDVEADATLEVTRGNTVRTAF